MPDEPRPQDAPNEDELDAELAEFEAELFRAADGLPKEIVSPEPPTDVESSPPPKIPSREEIDARLSKAIQEAESYLGPVRSGLNDLEDVGLESEPPAVRPGRLASANPDLEDEIAGISRRGQEARTKHEKHVSRTGRESREKLDQTRGLALGFALAYGFVGPLLAGYLIGWLIDSSLGVQNVWQTWLTVGGLFLGFLFVVVMLSRTGSDSKE